MPFRKTISNQIQKILSRNKNDFILLLQMKPVFQTVQIRLLLLKIRAYSTMCQKLTWGELNKSESNLRSRGKSSMINSMKVIKSLQQWDHNFCLRHEMQLKQVLLKEIICLLGKVDKVVLNLRPNPCSEEICHPKQVLMSLASWRIKLMLHWPEMRHFFWLP